MAVNTYWLFIVELYREDLKTILTLVCYSLCVMCYVILFCVIDVTNVDPFIFSRKLLN